MAESTKGWMGSVWLLPVGRMAVSIVLVALMVLVPASVAQAQEEQPAIHVTWPNEGETLYAGPTSLQYSAPVRGYVEGAGALPAGATVRLEVVRGGAVTDSLAQPLDDSDFEFLANVNPGASKEYFPAEHAGCADECHLLGDVDLVAGELVLRLTLLAPDGTPMSRAERRIVVDHSATATIPVALVLQDGALPEGETAVPAGVTISSATWLYMWRSRHFLAQTGTDGHAQLNVEALSQAPTEYLIEVEPTIVDGVLYEGLESQHVTLVPGAERVEPVTLAVRAKRGAIDGQISPPDAALATVWAVCLVDGRAFQAPVAEDGSFHFEGVPLDRYRLALDTGAPLPVGYRHETSATEIDLTANARQDVTIPLLIESRAVVGGQITSDDGLSLPFAWATTARGDRAHAVLPVSGTFFLPDAPAERTALIFQAPGYFSRAAAVNPSAPEAASLDEQTFALTPHPETQMLEWGAGSLTVPDDSQVERSGKSLVLQRGWLWGMGAAEKPFTVRAGGHTLTISDGQFALEYLPPRRGWLYLLQGEAALVDGNSGARLDLTAGQMVNLLNEDGLRAVPYEPVVVAALQERGAPPVTQSWEQTLAARVRDGLARTGVGLAQIITFVTYILVCFSIIGVPAYILYLRLKK